MTAPRQILPGTTYLVTRRCAQRQFLLRPSNETNAIFLYVLAVAAHRFGVHIHAYCVLSNHFHLVLTDPFARLPAFEQYLDSLVARAVNASLGRWETFWAPASYSAVALLTPSDVVEKMAYVLANPVSAGLVARGSEWPGLWSGVESVGGPRLSAARPGTFFRSTGSMPEAAELALPLPPGFTRTSELHARLHAALDRLESRARRALGAARRFLGRAKVLTQDPRRSPHQHADRRALRPRVASRDPWKRIEALQRLAGFLERYRAAWEARLRGDYAAVFPSGTYLMRVLHHAPCAPA